MIRRREWSIFFLTVDSEIDELCAEHPCGQRNVAGMYVKGIYELNQSNVQPTLQMDSSFWYLSLWMVAIMRRDALWAFEIKIAGFLHRKLLFSLGVGALVGAAIVCIYVAAAMKTVMNGIWDNYHRWLVKHCREETRRLETAKTSRNSGKRRQDHRNDPHSIEDEKGGSEVTRQTLGGEPSSPTNAFKEVDFEDDMRQALIAEALRKRAKRVRKVRRTGAVSNDAIKCRRLLVRTKGCGLGTFPMPVVKIVRLYTCSAFRHAMFRSYKRF